MPALERRTLPQSLSIVATKGRRLFSSRDAPSDPTAPRTSALSFNEALEQGFSSPFCLSNQLSSPQPSISTTQTNAWGKEFGRRRSSNTTTTSNSSSGGGGQGQEGQQRRRKSLFSKKARSEQMTTENGQTGEECRFVDPFAHHSQQLNVETEKHSDGFHDLAVTLSRTSTHRLSYQQQKKKEALDRVSSLVCLSVEENQRSAVCSPSTSVAPSPAPCDGYFYPIDDSAVSPTSPYFGTGAVTFPLPRNVSNSPSSSRFTMSTSFDTNPQSWEHDAASSSYATSSDGTSGGFHCFSPTNSEEEGVQQMLLLPASMRPLRGKIRTGDTDKRSNTSLKAEVGHGFTAFAKQNTADWQLFEQSRPSLRPPPPLRPTRHPMRNRSKSLSASTAVQGRAESPPPPPVPFPPSEFVFGKEVVGPRGTTPLHTPPRSRRSSSGFSRRGGGCGSSLASATSDDSLGAAPFHTPTFGSSEWTTLPVA